jgi:hypothetical protein
VTSGEVTERRLELAAGITEPSTLLPLPSPFVAGYIAQPARR